MSPNAEECLRHESHSPAHMPSSWSKESSPSPSSSPSPALLSCPALDRSFSGVSTVSSLSSCSSASNRSSGEGLGHRRRGYVRPQGAAFAESAKNRDSVMSLGSIAHLQYYFARTGLLDGKGAQLAKELDLKRKSPVAPRAVRDDDQDSQALSSLELEQSPLDFEDYPGEWDGSAMLPPTVSTYNHRNQYVPPPPDAVTLRRELRNSLGYVSKAVEEARSNCQGSVFGQESGRGVDGGEPQAPKHSADESSVPDQPNSPNRGWHQIQGMHMLDVVTLAIKAAKDYYTMHERPERLNKIKSERQIREDLLKVMDVLKRIATRNFAGGLKEAELDVIEDWKAEVENLLAREQDLEGAEAKQRESWTWLDDAKWPPGQVERECAFLQTFMPDGEELPSYTSPTSEAAALPTPFLEALRNGLTLVRLHNAILKRSKRTQFCEIKNFHTDTLKPYRAAENLRFWIKAAELRWEIRLKVDVLGVVYGRGPEIWREFDRAILEWAAKVRVEISKELTA